MATRSRKPKEESTGNATDFSVAFGNVTMGDKKASVTVTVERSLLKLSKADKLFCGNRLTGKIISKPASDSPGQQTFPGMDNSTELQGSFDVNSFRVSEKSISFGLSFPMKNLDLATLGHFAKRHGSLVVDSVEALTDEEEGGEEAGEKE